MSTPKRSLSESKAEPEVKAEPKAAPKAEAKTQTPEQWAVETGNVKSVRLPEFPGLSPLYSWQHASAAVVHGWREHAHHAGAPMQLTREDYEAALRSASTAALTESGQPIDPKGDVYRPHPPALSPYKHISR